MKEDDIIKLARECGINTEPNIMAVMERFATLVAAAEREAYVKQRGTLLFNPYSGKPRHPSDIASDPHGILMVEPDALTRAAQKVEEPTDWSAA